MHKVPLFPSQFPLLLLSCISLVPLLQFMNLYLNFYLFFWLHWVFIAAYGLSLVVLSGGYALVSVLGLLVAVASRCRAGALGHGGSVAVVHRLTCPVACGIFLDQGSIPCIGRRILNHWITRGVL